MTSPTRPARVPASTYRLQVRGDLDLFAAADLVPYLEELGITDLYVSPLATARAGSAHGYDVVDPGAIDPAIGGEEGLSALAAALRERGMGLLLDIVPSHVAASVENPWWRDLLARGRESPYARFFDVDWGSPRVGGGKLLLPVLGETYGAALAGGAFRLGAGEAAGEAGPVLRYGELTLPLAAGSLDDLGDGRQTDLEAVRRDPRLLDRVISRQHYRPAAWRLAPHAINYRRFFDISDLAGLRIEEPEVFAAVHRRPLELIAEGVVTGLRIDHVDGLRDPGAYLERLREAAAPPGGGPLYVVVEKILAGDEELPSGWPVAGTTGYDALNSLTGLFVEPQGLRALDRLYARWTGLTEGFAEVRYRRKRQALAELFDAEVEALTDGLAALAAEDLHARDLPRPALRRAIEEVTACLPVYRIYATEEGPSEQDRRFLAAAFAEARERSGAASRKRSAVVADPLGPAVRPLLPLAFDFLEEVLALASPSALGAGVEADDAHARRRDLAARWQQLTGPAMAKGLEDTALYVYNRLISLNAVGGEPEGIDPPGDAGAFHRRNARRRERRPWGMTATSTHDAKRSEDVRARIDVLSELPGEWGERLDRWSEINRAKKRSVQGRLVPGPNAELLLYQTLVGAWPLGDPAEADFPARLEEYLLKAAREAKVHTSWLAPDEVYEEALAGFARDLFAPGANPFLDDLLGFQQRIAFYGAWNSLSQLVLQVASPGVSDFYQGTELWNLHLVDPDNRRPVDWDLRRRSLDELARREAEDRPALLADALAGWPDGRIKLWVTWKALTLRRERAELFLDGDYRPLAPEGLRAGHVVGFARRSGDDWLVAAVPRFLTRLVEPPNLPVGEVWRDVAVPLPEGAPGGWRDALSGEEVRAVDGRLVGPDLFSFLPVALLVACRRT